jgi:hypothetical protein
MQTLNVDETSWKPASGYISETSNFACGRVSPQGIFRNTVQKGTLQVARAGVLFRENLPIYLLERLSRDCFFPNRSDCP